MKKKVDLNKLKKTVEPKAFKKDKGLDIAISLIDEFVDFNKLSSVDQEILKQSILILEKVKSADYTDAKAPANTSKKAEVKYVNCPLCKCKLRDKNYQKHMTKVHTEKKKPVQIRKARKKIDMLDSWALVSGSFGSGKRR